MAIVNLSAPWVEHYRKLQELFRLDRDVNVVFDAEAMKIQVYVDNTEKAEALEKILLPEVTFGNVTVPIIVIPANNPRVTYSFRYLRSFSDGEDFSVEGKYRAAFSTNGVVEAVVPAVGIGGQQILFILFGPFIAQYYNDDIGDLYGLHTTVFEDIARDVCVKEAGVFYCTSPRVERE